MISGRFTYFRVFALVGIRLCGCQVPLLFFPRTFWSKNIPNFIFNAEKCNSKNTLISEFAEKTVRAVSAIFWRKSLKTHPNWNDHEYHFVIGSGHTGHQLIRSFFFNHKQTGWLWRKVYKKDRIFPVCPLVLKRGGAWPFKRSKNNLFLTGNQGHFTNFYPYFAVNQGKSSVKIPPYYYPFKEMFSILYPILREVKDKIFRENKTFPFK